MLMYIKNVKLFLACFWGGERREERERVRQKMREGERELDRDRQTDGESTKDTYFGN